MLILEASEEDIEERASQWDQPVPEYIDLSEKYLGFQQPGSLYGFSDAGNGFKRVCFCSIFHFCYEIFLVCIW